MSILSILIPLIIVGVVLYCVNAFIPMDDRIRQVVNIVAIVLVLLWILQVALHGTSTVKLN